MCKRGLEQFLLNCGITLLLVVCMSILAAAPGRPCPIAYRCSNVEQVVWSTDGSRCFVWRNACHLNNENCQRQNSKRQGKTNISSTVIPKKKSSSVYSIYPFTYFVFDRVA